jgi:hypothetical protein
MPVACRDRNGVDEDRWVAGAFSFPLDNESFWWELRTFPWRDVPNTVDPVAVIIEDELAASILEERTHSTVDELAVRNRFQGHGYQLRGLKSDS